MSVLCGLPWETQTELGLVHCERDKNHAGEHRYTVDGVQTVSWGKATPPRLTEILIDTATALSLTSNEELHAALEALEESYHQSLRRLVTVPSMTSWMCTECGSIAIAVTNPGQCAHQCDSPIVPISPGLHRELMAARAKRDHP